MTTNVWIHLVQLLSSPGTSTIAKKMVPSASPGGAGASGLPLRDSRVTVTSRASSQTIIVMWCNPRFGYYGAQIWRIATAGSGGICDMSGSTIKPGDAIYKPRRARPAPVNLRSMILAKFVDYPEEFEADDTMDPLTLTPGNRDKVFPAAA